MVESNRRSWNHGPREGSSARDKAMAMAMKRKEDYLGARVPRWLKDKVIERAKEIGVPVSILIRNVLEDTFREGGAAQVAQLGPSVDTKAGTRQQEPALRFPSVVGWKEIQLNRAMACGGCGQQLQAGAYVTLGFASPGEEYVILCGLCKESL